MQQLDFSTLQSVDAIREAMARGEGRLAEIDALLAEKLKSFPMLAQEIADQSENTTILEAARITASVKKIYSLIN